MLDSFVPFESFEYSYRGSDVLYGRGRVAELSERLDDLGHERALVVCGSNVGANDDLMDPVRRGLGDALVGVFDETTPRKRIDTAYDLIDAVEAADADVVIGLGGGSSINVARLMCGLNGDGRTLSEIRAEARERGEEVHVEPSTPTPGVVVVPTTFAGADMSSSGSLEILDADESPTGQPIHLDGSVTPELVVEDPALFETTPYAALAGSLMNGFDKGIETTYSRHATPITDATAVHGLAHLRRAIPRLDDDPAAMEEALVGHVLVQFERKTSLVHAFGHALARHYHVQQGVGHAVVVPHVLDYVYDEVDGRRAVLAAGLGVETAGASDEAVATGIVEGIADVCEELGLPRRLAAVEGVSRTDFDDLAEFVLHDAALDRRPADLDPTAEDLVAILEAAW